MSAQSNGHHHYKVKTTWTGNLGSGTAAYHKYSRDHEVSAEGKRHVIFCSSDPAFRGDATRYNPEEMLVASLSACHMLWLLHLCADAGITVTQYVDEAIGTLSQHKDGSGEFTEVVLRPKMVITDAARIRDAEALHRRAHELCFIARSMNFPVRHDPVVVAEGTP